MVESLPLVADLMVGTKLVSSKSAARRTIAEGGAYLNNQRSRMWMPRRVPMICCMVAS